MDWMEVVESPTKNKGSLYRDSKTVVHTTIKKRKGKSKGARGKIQNLKKS